MWTIGCRLRCLPGTVVQIDHPLRRIGQAGVSRGEHPMATTENAAPTSSLQDLAKRHLWLHYARMGAYDQGADIPVLVRGEGCHVWDEHGNRYFDGLSALFCVNIGHGRADVAQAGADQARELGFYTNWSYAH